MRESWAWKCWKSGPEPKIREFTKQNCFQRKVGAVLLFLRRDAHDVAAEKTIIDVDHFSRKPRNSGIFRAARGENDVSLRKELKKR